MALEFVIGEESGYVGTAFATRLYENALGATAHTDIDTRKTFVPLL